MVVDVALLILSLGVILLASVGGGSREHFSGGGDGDA